VTSATRIAWTEPSASGDRLLLVIDLRPLAGLAVAGVLIVTPLLAAPLGRLSSPLAMLVVLPPLALALEAFGWRDQLAAQLTRIRSPLPRLVVTYAAWLVTSATLTLDVAAVAAASVGIAVARDDDRERRWHLGGAILGANVGSLLLPYSNLTNLVLVSASGVGFAAYVGLALWPQLAAALAVGALFAIRARGSGVGRVYAHRTVSEPVATTRPRRLDTAGRAAGAVALVGAASAMAAGLGGADVAVPFAISAGVLAGFAAASGRLAVRDLVRSIPVAGPAVIGFAAIASGPITVATGVLPQADTSLGGLLLALAVGGLLAAAINNLPAAALGATWLVRAHPPTIVAFLIGTNVAALATPHGSVATILAHAVGERHGIATPGRTYLRSAWRYASVGAIAAIVVLSLVAR
jgi:arsenical pump membrane protein